jgi:hypothetical protein
LRRRPVRGLLRSIRRLLRSVRGLLRCPLTRRYRAVGRRRPDILRRGSDVRRCERRPPSRLPRRRRSGSHRLRQAGRRGQVHRLPARRRWLGHRLAA